MRLIAVREETDSRSPIKGVDLEYEWTVYEVSIPEFFSDVGISEREEGSFSKTGEWGCACWCFSAGIELAVDVVFEEDDVFIGFDLKLYDWVTGWEEEFDDFFDEILDLQIRRSSTEEAEYKIDDSFGYKLKKFQNYYQKKFPEQVDLQKFINFILQSRVVCLSQNVPSITFWCLKEFDFQATVF